MRQVEVNVSWVINAFENSDGHSHYYLNLRTGDVKFFDPMDFPEHVNLMRKFDQQPERFTKLPKRDQVFCWNVKKEYLKTVADPYLKGLLETAVANLDEKKFRSILMEYGEERRRWYCFEHARYKEFLLQWFQQKGIELVDRPASNALEYNKKKQ